MPDQNQQEVALPQGYQVGTTIVAPMPAARAFPLTDPEFRILCDGTNGDERAGRDLHIGLFISGIIGIIGLLSCVDWPSVFPQKHWVPVVCFLALVAIAAVSLWGCVHHWRVMRKEDTAYTRLKETISSFFQAQTS